MRASLTDSPLSAFDTPLLRPDAVQIPVRADVNPAVGYSGTGVESAALAQVVHGQNFELGLRGNDVRFAVSGKIVNLAVGQDGRRIHLVPTRDALLVQDLARGGVGAEGDPHLVVHPV